MKKMNLKSPDVFLTLVLKEFEITNFGRFFMCLFYITCYLWHYPCHSVSILKAVCHVTSFKIRNFFNRRKESWCTYSTYAETLKDCTYCNFSMLRAGNLAKHEKIYTSNTENKKKCVTCDEVFYSYDELFKHSRTCGKSVFLM